MLYLFHPCHKNRDFSFFTKGNNLDDISDFFKFNKNNKFLSKPRINLSYDSEFETQIQDILKDDFYFSCDLLLFSKNFYEKSKDYLNEDCDFFQCLLRGQPSEIYALYIKNEFDIKNYDKNKNNRKIFRDINKSHLYAVTDDFINFIKREKFLINYLELREEFIIKLLG